MSEPTMADLLSMQRLILDHDRGHHGHLGEPECPECEERTSQGKEIDWPTQVMIARNVGRTYSHAAWDIPDTAPGATDE